MRDGDRATSCVCVVVMMIGHLTVCDLMIIGVITPSCGYVHESPHYCDVMIVGH